MSPTTLILISIIFIILFYWTASYFIKHGVVPNIVSFTNNTKKKYDEYYKTPTQLYEKTIGYVKDQISEIALKKGIKKEEMYKNNEKQGGISAKNLPDAINNAFTVGNLYLYNEAPNLTGNERIAAQNKAGEYYDIALNRLLQNPTIPHAEFIIDRIEDYYEHLIAEQILNETNNNHQPRTNFNQIREFVAENRVNQANTAPSDFYLRSKNRTKKVNETQKQFAREVYYDTKEVRNDAQNVHETNVVNEMKNKYDEIKELNENEKSLLNLRENKDEFITDIKQKINNLNKQSNNEKYQKALQTLDIMNKHNYISSLNTTETDVLRNVWYRINSHENESNKDNLVESFVTSLSDCIESDWSGKDHPVCITGRVTRVLNSLTLMDNNEKISQPVKTTEILRNEIFGKTYKIIQDELTKTDIDVAHAYNGANESMSPELKEKVEIFENHLKQTISDDIRNSYPDVKQETLVTLIKEAQAGI